MRIGVVRTAGTAAPGRPPPRYGEFFYGHCRHAAAWVLSVERQRKPLDVGSKDRMTSDPGSSTLAATRGTEMETDRMETRDLAAELAQALDMLFQVATDPRSRLPRTELYTDMALNLSRAALTKATANGLLPSA